MAYNFDPQLAAVIPMLPASDFGDVAASRAAFTDLIATVNASIDVSSLIIEDRVVAGSVPIRIYKRASPAPSANGVPAVLHIHGGGFAVGSIDTEHGSSAQIAKLLGVTVVAVEYRLAPEHPFPAGLDDCYAALVWLHGNAAELGVDTERIAVFGNSAGGGLAAGLALLARDRGGPRLCFQYLGIPELDDRLETVSMRTFVDTPMWHRPNAELSWSYYLGDSVREVSPYAAPARATDLAGLPPAYISTMEFDPLRDEGIIYALRLLEAGVSVELHQYPGTFHGSALVTDAAVSRRQAAETMDVLSRALGLAAE